MNKLIIPSKHFNDDRNSSYWRKDVVGQKALGIYNLPPSWTPPFIVLTTYAYKKWKEYLSFKDTENLNDNWLISEARLNKYIPHLKSDLSKTVIIRSNSVTESLKQRGKYESKKCDCILEDIIKGVFDLWNQQNKETLSSGSSINDDIALIVQMFMPSFFKGHLSNERRISQRKTNWLCEFEKSADLELTCFRINTKINNSSDNRNALFCKSFKELKRELTLVSSISGSFDKRCHFEWVWCNGRLWIVQKDLEEEFKSLTPGSYWSRKNFPSLPENFEVFIIEERSKNDWEKIKCLRTFRKCNLPHGKVFILEDENIIKDLIIKKVNKNLENDLIKLTNSPIVIRTDHKVTKDSPILLKRSDTIKNIEGAIIFLKKTSAEFEKCGLKPDEFCFIIHQFILARSSAISYSKPGRNIVRIDSLWGFADGLSFYPHDSYEAEIGMQKKIKKRLRCKAEYLDIDNNGRWIERRCGKPWDWKSSLTDDEIYQIAEYSMKITQYLKQPVEVMFFVGVSENTCYPKILPWYYNTQIPQNFDFERSKVRFSGKKILIRNEWDLSKLKSDIDSDIIGGRINIRLKPELELIRSKEFINMIAEFVSRGNYVVELEGSILSHIYYILSRKRAKVRCIEAFEPKIKKQIFGKLIRDKIPKKIQSHGEEAYIYEAYKDKELWIKLLKDKAIEEALELFWAPDQINLFEELADLLEVIQSICRLYNRNFEKLKETAEKKRLKRGGFEKGIILLETNQVPLLSQKRKQLDIFGKQNIFSFRESNKKGEISPSLQIGVGPPKIKGEEIIIPLIPSMPNDKKIILNLSDGVNKAIIRYTKKEVIIKIEPRKIKQLPLFPEKIN